MWLFVVVGVMLLIFALPLIQFISIKKRRLGSRHTQCLANIHRLEIECGIIEDTASSRFDKEIEGLLAARIVSSEPEGWPDEVLKRQREHERHVAEAQALHAWRQYREGLFYRGQPVHVDVVTGEIDVYLSPPPMMVDPRIEGWMPRASSKRFVR